MIVCDARMTAQTSPSNVDSVNIPPSIVSLQVGGEKAISYDIAWVQW